MNKQTDRLTKVSVYSTGPCPFWGHCLVSSHFDSLSCKAGQRVSLTKHCPLACSPEPPPWLFDSQGRRSDDDERQIGRWQRCAGVKGRWRNNLVTKVFHSKAQRFDDPAISPVVRQTLLHWAYELTKSDYDAQAKVVAKRK